MNKEYKVILENNNLNFLYKENKINVKVIYRKRKTISIRIIPKDNIEIISPKALSISYLKNVLMEKSSWIIKTLDKFENLEEDFKEKQYTNGEVFYYLGEKYILTIVEDKNTALITITEGKYHQIKRMFGCFGAKVVNLHRISMGGLQLPSDLTEGQCRELTAEELEKVCIRDK